MFDGVYGNQINKQKNNKRVRQFAVPVCLWFYKTSQMCINEKIVILMVETFDPNNGEKKSYLLQVLFVFDTQPFHGAGQRDHRMLVFINALFVL